MANITDILGGPWSPPQQPYRAPPEAQLQDAIRAAGMEAPEETHLDGRLHRFRTGSKGKAAGDKTGWYVAFSDGVPAGKFGDWRTGIEQNWRADIGRKLTAGEEMANLRRMEEAKRLRDAEREKTRAVAADTVGEIWSQAVAASPDHPYLARKGVQAHGARATGDGRLVVPLFNADGELRSLQYIAHDGGKLYHPGGQTGACFWQIGSAEGAQRLFIAEGFATAATIHEATGQPCLVAYSASNLVPVSGAAREQFGAMHDIIVVADNDASGTGQKYADQAAAKFGVSVITPPQPGDANDYAMSGGDLAELLTPTQAADDGWLIQADDFSAQPAPISWLVKGWLQSQALIMVHGMSGGGKTFAVLDMVLRIAADKPMDWMDCKVKQGCVVYLAGEGHHGLRARIAGWKHLHGVERLNAWLSKDGCDLNTPQGYLRVTQAIRAAGLSPSIIIVDTLHRFLSGDENSAQDAKTMLDACSGLMGEFACSVLLVHHTGVSEEAQHRARGSSAWRGALDIEISVVPSKGDGAPLSIVQRKSKDAELAAPIFATLDSTTIPGWIDEDGEPVTTACLSSKAEAPRGKPSKQDIKLHDHITTLRDAWEASGSEQVNGAPYITSSAIKSYLVNELGLTEESAKTYVKESATGRMVHALLTGEVIIKHNHGWLVTDGPTAAAWTL